MTLSNYQWSKTEYLLTMQKKNTNEEGKIIVLTNKSHSVSSPFGIGVSTDVVVGISVPESTAGSTNIPNFIQYYQLCK